MARTNRSRPADEVFDVLNRGVARLTIFELSEDYAALLRVVEETWGIVPLSIHAIAAMPKHWRSSVRKVETEAARNALRRSVKRGLPFDDDSWTRSSAVRRGLETTSRH